MKKRFPQSAILLALLAVLTLPLSPLTAQAGHNPFDEDRPIKLYARAGLAPIGRLRCDYSDLSALKIDGRAAQPEEAIWPGQLLQLASTARVRLSFDSLGEVTLTRGARVRFAKAMADQQLIVTLQSGELSARLDPQAAAYIEAADTPLSSSRGASFRIRVSNGKVISESLTGALDAEMQTSQRRYVVRPVGIGSNISVRARSTRQIQVRVTDENDKPVPDLPIIFALGGGSGQAIGSLGGGTSATVKTNAQGIASTDFTAGDNAGNDTLSATVEGTRFSWQATIFVTKRNGFWTTQNKIIVIAAVGAGIAIAILATSGDDDNLRPLPPPDVRP